MDSGIEFGKLEQQGPQPRLRPDCDRQYAVVSCGVRDEMDLPIFVDLDVMREMEGHARTNTRVELGGVLLGGKFVDDTGRPFVVVHEAIRAEHYEATRGSFKFTHDTWADITRQRGEFPPQYQLVGWYHTHPDWGVFLSGMDMFICENFFNDDLDVALVIDPCRGDRGWFHWDRQSGQPGKRRVDGFYLFANRYRRSELLHFASELATINPAYHDSRYESSFGETDMQPIVHLHQQQSMSQLIAITGMLTIQTLILALIAWRILSPSGDESHLAQEHRNQIYREILGQFASDAPNGAVLVEQIEKVAQSNASLQTSVDGQALLINNLSHRGEVLNDEKQKLQNDLDMAIRSGYEKNRELESLRGKVANLESGNPASGYSWPVLAALAAAAGLAGLVGGWFWGGSGNSALRGTPANEIGE
jgi:proteasome lid subunit RPN8/RPN11